jgi:hypothetical protein
MSGLTGSRRADSITDLLGIIEIHWSLERAGRQLLTSPRPFRYSANSVPVNAPAPAHGGEKQ